MGNIEIKGKKRKEILEKAREIIKKWGLVLPSDYILVLDFGLGEFEKIGHIEFFIVNRERQNYCGKFIFMFKGQTCPVHYHKKKDETFFIVKGKVKMVYNRKVKILYPGDVLIMPVNTEHTFTGLESSLLLEVSNASILKDNFFKDDKINKNILVISQ